MACQTQGIQQLLTAEKRAAEKVAEAKKRKARRIKQARDEAEAEIEKYRQQRERQFREYEAKYMGSREVAAAKIDQNNQILIENMKTDIEQKKEKVLQELLHLVYDIEPEVHRNYFVVNPKPEYVLQNELSLSEGVKPHF